MSIFTPFQFVDPGKHFLELSVSGILVCAVSILSSSSLAPTLFVDGGYDFGPVKYFHLFSNKQSALPKCAESPRAVNSWS